MSFDPYLEWFRIPPKKRVGDAPPDHYTLLGVRRFEKDANRVHEAALKRMQLLRTRQAGARGELTQRLMNEVSQARLCLTDASRKAQYDFELQQQLSTSSGGKDASRAGPPVWLTVGAALLLIGGGAATYFAIMRPTEQDEVTEANPETQPEPSKKPAVEKEPSKAVAQAPAAVDPKNAETPAKAPPAVRKTRDKEAAPLQALVKLRDLPTDPAARTTEGDVVHLATIATEADEEDPCFLDREGRLLGFQRKAGGILQFVVGERAGVDQPFTVEHLLKGLPDGKLQGFALEPGERSCIVATADGKGLLRATRRNATSPWTEATPLLVADQPLKAAWPSLNHDGTELFCVQQRSGKNRVLLLKRPSPDASFAAPVELTSLGPSFTQAAVSPDGKTLVLRGPEDIYVSRRDEMDGWSKPEPVPPLRASAGPNRALVLSPCFSPDGDWLLFSSNRDGGVGGFDLWAAPTSMLKTEPPDLSKLTIKDSTKKKPPTKSDGSKKKVDKSKVAGDGKKKAPAKVAPQPAPTGDTAVTETISEWLVLGPYPDATKEVVKSTADFSEFEGVQLLRRMPKEAQKADNALTWKRAMKFDAPGVYSVALSLRLKTNATVRLVVESAPGGGVLWLDGEYNELTWRPGDVWKPLDGERQGEPVSLIAGRHRLAGIVCVGDPSKPLTIRVVNADGGALVEGLSVSY